MIKLGLSFLFKVVPAILDFLERREIKKAARNEIDLEITKKRHKDYRRAVSSLRKLDDPEYLERLRKRARNSN